MKRGGLPEGKEVKKNKYEEIKGKILRKRPRRGIGEDSKV